MTLVGKLLAFLDRVAIGGRRRLRRQYYRHRFRRMGTGCNIEEGVLITAPENIVFGNYVNLNERVILQSCDRAAIELGNYVTLSYDVLVLTGGYDLNGDRELRIHHSAAVVIEDHVWIGVRAVILPGVRIGEGAVVAAGSVVTRDVAAYTLVAGVPARVIRQLDPPGQGKRDITGNCGNAAVL